MNNICISFASGLAAIVTFGTPLAASAQNQAAGLWENTMTMKSASGEYERAMAEMQKRMASLTPEQRQQAEAMMSRGGMKFGPQGTTVQVCVSKEEAAKPPEARMMQGAGDCKPTDVKRSGNTMTYRVDCPRAKGQGEMTLVNDKTFTGHVVVDSTATSGKAEQMTMELSGHWVSSDCGDVKPRSAASSK
jgi:Protein of unknown function (DUF3617)